MSTICFLLDEHVPPFIQAQLARLEPNLRVYMIGDDLAPVRGTPDPDVLLWIEAHGCLLVTNNHRLGRFDDHSNGPCIETKNRFAPASHLF